LFVAKEIMKKIDLMKNFRQVKFTTDHTLSTEQLSQLIRDKLERAERQYAANRAYIARAAKQTAEDRT
jgi:hypothetical protein